MANKQEFQQIDDATVREVATVIENHKRDLHDHQLESLRKELSDLKYTLVMSVKTLKVREASNRILTMKHSLVERECKKKVGNVNNERDELKSFIVNSNEKNRQTMEEFRKSREDWEEKEQRFIQEIENIGVYINSLHSTLDRHGIYNDQYIEESDDYESNGFEVNWNQFLDRRDDQDYDSDTQFADDDDDDDLENQFQYQQASYGQQQNAYNDLRQIPDQTGESNDCVAVADGVANYAQAIKPNDCVSSASSVRNDCVGIADEVLIDQEVQYSELIQTNQCAEDPVETFAEPMASESKISTQSNPECSGQVTKPKEQNWCNMVEEEESAKIDQLNPSIEPAHVESSASQSTCDIVDEKPQQASSTSNARTEDKVLEADRPIEAEVPFKINMDPFVHGYVEKQIEKLMPNSKPKKQRQQKSKSRPKFSSMISFGGY